MSLKEKFEEAMTKVEEKKSDIASKRKAKVAEKLSNETDKVAEKVKKYYKNNNSKKLFNLSEKLADPDKFEDIYKKAVFDSGDHNLAEKAINTILYGDKNIKSMVNYQNTINDLIIQDMALLMVERSFVIPQEFITDPLAEKLQNALDRLGRGAASPDTNDKVYTIKKDENGMLVIDPNKLILNRAIRVEDSDLEKSGFSAEDIQEIKRLDAMYKIQDDVVNEEKDSTETKDQKVEAEKAAEKKVESIITPPVQEIKNEEEAIKEKALFSEPEKIIIETPQSSKGIDLDEVIDDPLNIDGRREGL